MRAALALSCLLGCTSREPVITRSAPLGPEDARGPIAMVEANGTIEVAWTAGAPLHVVSASVRPSLAAQIDEVGLGVGRSSAEPALAATGSALVLAFRAETDAGGVVLRVERDEGPFSAALPRDQVSFAPTAYQPALVALDDGTVMLAFDQWTDTGYGVSLATRDPAGAWTGARDASDVVSPPIFHANAPRWASGPGGTALLTWYQSLGGPLLVHVRERDASGVIGSSAPDGVVSLRDRAVDSHPIANPRPVLGPDGEAAVVWTAEAGSDVRVYVATRSDGAWTVPRDVDDALSLRGRAACAVPIFTSRGDLVVVWQVDEGDGWSIAGAERIGGAWSEGTRLLPHAFEPALAAIDEELVLVATALEGRQERVVIARGDRLDRLGPARDVSEDGEAGSAPALLVSDAVYVAYLAGPPFSARLRVARIE